jgi:hypothetical protein
VDEARIGARLVGEHVGSITGRTILDDSEKGEARSADETPAVVTAAAEALDGGAHHTPSVALLPHWLHGPNPCRSRS